MHSTAFCEVWKTQLLSVLYFQEQRKKNITLRSRAKKEREREREPYVLFTPITSFVVAFPPPMMLEVHYHRHFLLPTAHCLNRQKGKERRKRMVGKPWQRAILWLSQDSNRSAAEFRVTAHPRTLPNGPPHPQASKKYSVMCPRPTFMPILVLGHWDTYWLTGQ